MRATIMRWDQFARTDAADRVVLLDRGLVTVRKIGADVDRGISKGPARFYVDFRTPWGKLMTKLVTGTELIAVLDSDPQDQEKEE